MNNFHNKDIPKLGCVHPFLHKEFISNPGVQNPDWQSKNSNSFSLAH